MCCFISRDGREWHTSNTPSEHSGYRSMGHPVNVPSHHMIDPYGGGYHATGHPSDVPIQHMNDAYPPSSHYDDPFMSGHPNHDPNSYPSSRDPEIGYPHSGRPFNRHSSLEHPSNAPGSDLSQLNGKTASQMRFAFVVAIYITQCLLNFYSCSSQNSIVVFETLTTFFIFDCSSAIFPSLQRAFGFSVKFISSLMCRS